MKRIRLVLLTLLLVSPLVQGAYVNPEEVRAFYIGNQLLETCKANVDNTDPVKGEVCSGYLMGVIDLYNTFDSQGYLTEKLWCIPKDVTSGQLARIIVKYLENNPERLHMGASSLTAFALILAFPCN